MSYESADRGRLNRNLFMIYGTTIFVENTTLNEMCPMTHDKAVVPYDHGQMNEIGALSL